MFSKERAQNCQIRWVSSTLLLFMVKEFHLAPKRTETSVVYVASLGNQRHDCRRRQRREAFSQQTVASEVRVQSQASPLVFCGGNILPI